MNLLRSYCGGRWRTCVSWFSHTSTNTTFLSKTTNYFSHMLQQRREAKICRKDSSPQPGIELTTTRSCVWHAHHWATRAGLLVWSRQYRSKIKLHILCSHILIYAICKTSFICLEFYECGPIAKQSPVSEKETFWKHFRTRKTAGNKHFHFIPKCSLSYKRQILPYEHQ